MLVLTRKVGEEVVLMEGAMTVTVLEVVNGHVRLGITAPRHLRVDRAEVHEARLSDRERRVANG